MNWQHGGRMSGAGSNGSCVCRAAHNDYMKSEIQKSLKYSNILCGKRNMLHVEMSITLRVNFSNERNIQFLYTSYRKLSIDLGVLNLRHVFQESIYRLNRHALNEEVLNSETKTDLSSGIHVQRCVVR
jgi:hypothetical protein